MSGDKKAQHPLATMEQFLQARKPNLEKMLPKSAALSPDKLIKLALMAATRNPPLAKCDMGSVALALGQCAELGLEPSGTLGHAYLVPFKETCQLIIGYRGLIDLARRSGVLQQIRAAVVYERDIFEYEDGFDTVLRHVPTRAPDRGEIIAAWVVIRLANGAVHHDLMWRHEIDAVRARSRAKDSGPWVTDYAEMAKKTVARRALKWVPMSSELVKAFEAEDDHEVIDHAGLLERVVAPPSAPVALPQETTVERIEAPLDIGERATVEIETAPKVTHNSNRKTSPWDDALMAIASAKDGLKAEAAAERARKLAQGPDEVEKIETLLRERLAKEQA